MESGNEELRIESAKSVGNVQSGVEEYGVKREAVGMNSWRWPI